MIKIEKSVLAKVSKREGVNSEVLCKGLRDGHIVIAKNIKRRIKTPCAIGAGLSTKVNANIGLSTGNSSMDEEMKKMEAAVDAGADAVMDLSTGPHLEKLRKKILSACPVPVGTVPIYELACMSGRKLDSLREKDFVDIIEKQAEEGVDFFTVHAGLTLEAVYHAAKNPRIMNIVSRGGALLASWMARNGKENPFLTYYDKILSVCKKYNVTLSLGDSLRPGALVDGTDKLQIGELLVLGDLQERSLKSGVQVMIEGPGHMPMDMIETNMKLEKSLCHGAPFYVLGPLVTDAAPGYDHIVSAIGGAIAAWHGADFLCYVTPAEHLKLPDIEDVRMGVIASKIAAHAADIVKKVPGALDRDIAVSKARAQRNWKKQFERAIDPHLPERIRKTTKPIKEDVCTMCGEFCSIKVTEQSLKDIKRNAAFKHCWEENL